MSRDRVPTYLGPRTRTLGIRALLDEAHAALSPDAFAELLLAVRRALQVDNPPSRPIGELPLPTFRPGMSQAARVYFRPIELLLNVAATIDRPLSRSAIDALDSYLDELASRPRDIAAHEGAAA